MSGLVERVDIRIDKTTPPIDEKLDSVGVEYSLKRDDADSFPDKAMEHIKKNNLKQDCTIKVFLSIGSNMGDRKKKLKEALKLLDNNPGINILKISSLYETEPLYMEDQDSFYNIAVKIRVINKMGPFELLGLIKGIEYHMGRKKGEVRYGPRPIDVDILYFGCEKIKSDILQIPHPRIIERKFVLLPLSEISPDTRIDGIDIRTYIKKKNLPGKVELIAPF